MVLKNWQVIDRYFGSVADKNIIFLKKQCQHFKNNMYRNTIFAFRFITVFLMSSFLFPQDFMTPIQFEMEKREREEEYGEDNFTLEYIRKLAYLVSYWYTGNAAKENDFAKLIISPQSLIGAHLHFLYFLILVFLKKD